MSISTKTAFNTIINLPYGELNNVMDWCKKNCLGDWRFSPGIPHAIEHGLLYVEAYKFYFELERDYIAFLIWKK